MPVLSKISDAIYAFHCPGCETDHQVTLVGAHAWKWNGSLDKPTIAPSILIESGHYASSGCWCVFKETHPDCTFTCYRCHSFVTDGRIQFLADCSHKLANQTVDLPEWQPGNMEHD